MRKNKEKKIIELKCWMMENLYTVDRNLGAEGWSPLKREGPRSPNIVTTILRNKEICDIMMMYEGFLFFTSKPQHTSSTHLTITLHKGLLILFFSFYSIHSPSWLRPIDLTFNFLLILCAISPFYWVEFFFFLFLQLNLCWSVAEFPAERYDARSWISPRTKFRVVLYYSEYVLVQFGVWLNLESVLRHKLNK